jgi:hypothetical protein
LPQCPHFGAVVMGERHADMSAGITFGLSEGLGDEGSVGPSQRYPVSGPLKRSVR